MKNIIKNVLSQLGVTCRWRVRPGNTKRVLLILPQEFITSINANPYGNSQKNLVFLFCPISLTYSFAEVPLGFDGATVIVAA